MAKTVTKEVAKMDDKLHATMKENKKMTESTINNIINPLSKLKKEVEALNKEKEEWAKEKEAKEEEKRKELEGWKRAQEEWRKEEEEMHEQMAILKASIASLTPEEDEINNETKKAIKEELTKAIIKSLEDKFEATKEGWSAMVQAIVTFTNVCVLIFVIIAGAAIGFNTDWIGYRQADGYLPFGFNGMLGGAATVFFAYIGFDTVASTAEEVKHPQRDLPLGIGVALAICGSLYMLVSAVIVGIVPYTEIDVNTPMSSAFSRYGVQWAMYVVSAGAVAALSSTLMGSLLPQPRILMAMARDGLLPCFFLHVNKWVMVPINSTIVTGVVAMLLAFFMTVDQLSGMVSVGTLLAFAVVSASILILRFVPPADILISFPDKVSSSNQLLLPHIDTEAFFQASSGFQQDGSACPLLKQDQQQHVTSSDSTILQDNDQVSEGKDDFKRRRLAAMGIGSSCIGAILVAVGASGSLLPSWLQCVLASVGALGFLGGAITLSLLKQDEGQHTFGQSGGFLCPFVPWLPLLSILINVYLLANLGLSTWLRVGIWLILGAAVYFIYGLKHSLLSETGKVAQDFAPLS
ncbi:hypothetical protein L7F22_035188 [Adiantum nelumboides]|nr:hypothetical protein [Adiantum nelumboides]